MAIQLVRAEVGQTITLPDEFYWTDEFQNLPVVTDAQRSLQGTMIHQDFVTVSGTLVTLGAPSDMNWLPRSTLVSLKAWAATVGVTFTSVGISGLADGTLLRFNTSISPCIDADPVSGYESASPTADFHVTLHLITI